MLKIADGWKDYQIIATGDGLKLEKWKDLTLLRPDPQVIWPPKKKLENYKGINAKYVRSSNGGGKWKYFMQTNEEFQVERKGLKFACKMMGFKHTGLFPEQAVNWDKMIELINGAKRPIKVLNLFGYTGGATVACASAGAKVTHVDSAKAMVERCKRNAKLNNLPADSIRYIIDDCVKFVEREIRRGNTYDAILMDPPSYGRGAKGEVWRLEDNLYPLVNLTTKILGDNPLFFLINSYTTGLQPTVIKNIIDLNFGHIKGNTEAYEVGLPTHEGITLPCGCSGLRVFK